MGSNFVPGDYFLLGKPGKPRRLPAVILTAALVAGLAFIPTAALAEKGGKGKGHGVGNSTSVAWVSASPNPAPDEGSRVWLEGCGYELEPVEIHIVHSAGYTEAYGVGVWNGGCMNPTPFLTSEAGTYTIEVYQKSSQRLTLKASTVLSVG